MSFSSALASRLLPALLSKDQVGNDCLPAAGIGMAEKCEDGRVVIAIAQGDAIDLVLSTPVAGARDPVMLRYAMPAHAALKLALFVLWTWWVKRAWFGLRWRLWRWCVRVEHLHRSAVRREALAAASARTAEDANSAQPAPKAPEEGVHRGGA